MLYDTMRNPRLVLFIALLLLIPQGRASDKRVPELALRDLSGHTQKLSSLRGQIVVLNFWATWCGPCREELPLLARLNEQYSGRKVKFIAVSIDDPATRAQVRPYVEKQHLNLDVWLGGSVEQLDRYHLGQMVPATLILDPEGEITSRIMGEARDEDLRTRLDWLLNGRLAAAPEPLLKRY